MTIPSSESSPLTTSGHALNGILSTAVMLVTLQPLNTIKTYVMNEKKLPNSSLTYRWMSEKGLFRLSTLYRGMTPAATCSATIQCLSFFTQGMIVNHYFNGQRSNMSDTQKLLMCGMLAIATSPISTLFDRVMIQSQLNKIGPIDSVNKIIQKRGLLNLFKGYFPSFYRDVFFATALWGTADIFSKWIGNRLPKYWSNQEATSSILGKISAGALSGALSTPIDVIKTRMQGDLEDRYPSMIKTITSLYEKEGKGVFIKGIWIRSTLIGLSMLVMGISKERIPTLISRRILL